MGGVCIHMYVHMYMCMCVCMCVYVHVHICAGSSVKVARLWDLALLLGLLVALFLVAPGLGGWVLLDFRLVVGVVIPLALAGGDYSDFGSPALAVWALQQHALSARVCRDAAVVRGAAAPPLAPQDGVGQQVGGYALPRAYQLLHRIGAAAGPIGDVASRSPLPAAELRGTLRRGERREDFRDSALCYFAAQMKANLNFTFAALLWSWKYPFLSSFKIMLVRDASLYCLHED